MRKARSKTVRLAGSHVITTCATIAALLLFVALGSRIVPAALLGNPLPASDSTLKVAFLLNIAIILFGWRRSKDLKEALDAYEAAERLAQRNANTDPATGLANRRELMRSLEEALQDKSGGIFLVIDLDHFKRVNDLHGHLAGDKVLLRVAEACRKSAPDDACCARTGGDEFAVLLPGSDAATAEDVATRILSAVAEPLFVEGAQMQVTASIGLARLGDCGDEESALRQSDVALYAAKRSGRNGLAWFDKELEREITERLKLEEDIRHGIKAGEFVPFFQPLVDLATRQIIGFEALARWRSPARGLMEAEAFIETAERTGLIGPLTLSVLEQALKEARGWPGHLKLAVNVSPVQFRDAMLAEHILKLLAATGYPASRLEIEITEGSLLEDRDQVLTIIRSLKNVGVSISLDDFGTGYASLAQVNRLPLDRIKIDKSFITTIVKSQQTAAIVSTIAGLGHNLDVPITAEGVESEQIRNALADFGCSEAQGWLFGRAISAEAVRNFLAMSGETPMGSPASEEPPKARPRAKRRW
ncbi:putative bifunctional diguanylate cyclase/phosphodiesterase [Sphingomonas agri]|uniref:putative bifunctional diguanylate cyclase/phosphodiesterase n=1 Tax=Sphingomonas agri TaxID=1813878 RepID=UPI00311D788B